MRVALTRSPSKPKSRSALHRHLHQHNRFYAGAIAAAAAFFALLAEPLELRTLAAADAFFAVYLILLVWAAATATPESTKTHARIEDDGLALIAALTLGAAAVSLSAIIVLLTQGDTIPPLGVAAAVASVPLGWLTVHASMATHYARLYYRDAGKGEAAGGLDFTGEDKPDLWDFLYFSYTIGMTAQTSDVGVSGRRLRRLTLAHGVVSFFYNTIIVALAVNAAVQMAG